jgi:TrmH family RNA methyltransferase
MVPHRVGPSHPAVRRLLTLAKNAGPDSRDLLVEGTWAHEAVLAARARVPVFLWCPELATSARSLACVRRVAAWAEASYEVSRKTLARLSDREKPDGLVSAVRLPRWTAESRTFGSSALVLVADGIEYAGNLGTLIRTADACRADCVVLVNRQVRLTHRRVFVASRGTVLTTPVVEFGSASEAAAWLGRHGFEILLADPAARATYRRHPFSGARTAIVVGSEGHGLSHAWSRIGATPVSVPMLGVADSLNVGVSAAILLFEARARLSSW